MRDLYVFGPHMAYFLHKRDGLEEMCRQNTGLGNHYINGISILHVMVCRRLP